MRRIKTFDELTIQDNFIFQKTMRNKSLCKGTVQKTKSCEEWRREYMTREMELRSHEKESYEEGLAAGEARGKLEGLAVGEARGKLESYRNMIAVGLLTLEQVIASGQLSSEEIASLSRT